MKKVIFVCGLIGSGKTTFARANFQFVTDLDFMPQNARKIDQIMWTKRLLRKVPVVCHITCYPTKKELEAFKNYDISFILLATSFEQSKENILKRNRQRDMVDLNRVLIANFQYLSKFRVSHLPFKLVKVM
ncbi:TPA: hypothetical protein U1629_000836 [Streptococcus suis]|nr:hypothetical protein [Streptococcus suis]NQO21507.1 hypothetical protein [Streptococcus suis]NQP14917.1 hypothetical protein [Streptococcus suis]HEM5120720.1 hypothetical protein [Streptococcus suis]HEM5175844.1 hypothetical protein [Streptococcus suis]